MPMMGDANRRISLWPAVLSALVLAVGGFLLGRSNLGSAQPTRVVSGVVAAVGQAADEFAITLDGSNATESFPLGPVPWTDSTKGDGINEGSTPPCISVGRHATVGLVSVSFAGQRSDQVEWVKCG